jgi:hypothetical protein
MKNTNNNISLKTAQLSNMRTSNKILIGILVATILVFTTLFGAVRIKYERGDIVKDYKSEDNRPSADQPVSGPVKQVELFMVQDVTIIPSDSLKLKIWGNENHNVKYELKNGILTIMSDTLLNRNGNRAGVAYQHIELFIPAVDSFFCFNSGVTVKQTVDSVSRHTGLHFGLYASELRFEQRHGNEGPYTYFGNLNVSANPGSKVEIDPMVAFEQGNFKLNQAIMQGNGRFNKLAIQTDPVSSINLKGENLRKAIITSTE